MCCPRCPLRPDAANLPGHGINDPAFLQPDRPMSAIGG
jgi:cyclic pyranopterin phosphate synthase